MTKGQTRNLVTFYKKESSVAVRMRFRIRPLSACPASGSSLDLLQRNIPHLAQLEEANYVQSFIGEVLQCSTACSLPLQMVEKSLSFFQKGASR
jgi:hypothetical protein